MSSILVMNVRSFGENVVTPFICNAYRRGFLAIATRVRFADLNGNLEAIKQGKVKVEVARRRI